MASRRLWFLDCNVPLSCLPHRCRNELRILDHTTALTHGFQDLAEKLDYSPLDIYILRVHAHNNESVMYSPTIALILDFEQKGGTIGQVHNALVNIRHQAANIIPRYSNRIRKEYQRLIMGHWNNSDRSLQQNSECSVCQCAECIRAAVAEMQSNPFSRASFHSHFQTYRPSRNVHEGHSSLTPPPASLPINQMPPTGSHVYNPSMHQAAQERGTEGSSYSVPFSLPGDKYITAPETYQRRKMEQVRQRSQDNVRSEREDSRETENAQSPSTVFNSSENDCTCDKCRIRGDYEETQRLVIAGRDEEQVCVGPWRTRQSPVGSADADRLLQEASQDETGVKTVYCAENNVTDSNTADAHVVCCTMCGKVLDPINRSSAVCLSCQPSETPTTNQAKPKEESESERVSILPLARNSWHAENMVSTVLYRRVSNSDSEISSNSSYRDFSVVSNTSMLGFHHQHNNPGCVSSLESENAVHFANNLDVSDGEESCHSPQDQLNIGPSQSSNGAEGSSAPADSACEHIMQPLPSSENRKINIFLTYSYHPLADADNGDKLFNGMKKIVRRLIRKGISVDVDRDEEPFQRVMANKLDYLEDQVRKAHYVLVCITPTYFTDIQTPVDNEAQPRTIQLNARFIYDKLRDEYYRNNCRNRRVIPVCFTETGATYDHVPEFMRSTLVFSFPKNRHEIVQAVLGENIDTKRLH